MYLYLAWDVTYLLIRWPVYRARIWTLLDHLLSDCINVKCVKNSATMQVFALLVRATMNVMEFYS